MFRTYYSLTLILSNGRVKTIYTGSLINIDQHTRNFSSKEAYIEALVDRGVIASKEDISDIRIRYNERKKTKETVPLFSEDIVILEGLPDGLKPMNIKVVDILLTPLNLMHHKRYKAYRDLFLLLRAKSRISTKEKGITSNSTTYGKRKP